MSTPVGPYSPVVVCAGVAYTSGQIGIVDGALAKGGFEGQFRQALDNLTAVLTTVDATLANVVKTTVFLTTMDDYAQMNAIYSEVFGDHRPARSAIAVKELPLGAAVEIEAIAQLT